jgi:hypothetical protein
MRWGRGETLGSVDGCGRARRRSRSKAGEKGHGAQRRFAEEAFLNHQALEACQASREDYANVLAELGFLPREVVRYVVAGPAEPMESFRLPRARVACGCGQRKRQNRPRTWLTDNAPLCD